MFYELFKKKKISKEHYKNIFNLKKYVILQIKKKNKLLTPKNISTSLDFSNNSLSNLKKKIKLLKLNNINLIKGNFRETLPRFSRKFKNKILLANIDCDLYESYKLALNYIWPSLTKKGIIYLDEYYSLKFPGARIASNEFFKKKRLNLSKLKLQKQILKDGT